MGATLNENEIKQFLATVEYIVTTEDSEESHFINANSKEAAKKVYSSWSRRGDEMAKNTRIYKVIDITEEIKKRVTI